MAASRTDVVKGAASPYSPQHSTRKGVGVVRFRVSIVIVLPLLCVCSDVSAQGTLDELRSNVRSGHDDSDAHRKRQARRQSCGHSYACDCDDGSFFGDLVGALLSGMIQSAFSTDDDDDGKSRYSDTGSPWSVGYFPEYPYQGDDEGYMMIMPWIPEEPFTWSLRTRMEYLDDFDDMQRIGGHLLYETTNRFGIDGEVNYLREGLGIGVHDDLWIGDVNGLYRISQGPHHQWRVGVGMSWMADDVDADFGWNATTSLDLFPRDPFVLSTEVEGGKLGSAGLFHFRTTGGIQLNRAEVYLGFDYLEVGGAETSGLVSGLRFWF